MSPERPFLAPVAPAGLVPGAPPRFSVLIPAYQAAETIAGALESALDQTVAAHEVIVVNDGSTDSTADKVAGYRGRITYIEQVNRGAPAALNVALARATGDFVAILDADDAYEPERLEALTELAVVRPDLDLLMTDAQLEVEGAITGRFCEATPFATEKQDIAIFERCFVAWPAIRRELLSTAGGFDESMPIAYDWECWLRLLHLGAAAGLVAQPLIRYRIAGQGSLTDNRPAALRDRARVLEAAALLDLSAEQRAALERFLPRRRRNALLAEAHQALRAGAPEARRLSLAIARNREMPPITRLRSLAAAIAPAVAARRLAELESRTGSSRTRRVATHTGSIRK